MRAASQRRTFFVVVVFTLAVTLVSIMYLTASYYRVEQSSDLVAKVLSKNVRILCWILTGKLNHATKARAVKATWAKRCTKYLFMSTEEDAALPAIKLKGVKEGHDKLWGKTRAAFKYVYEKYRDDYDWFLKVDDDTYVILENLRFLLLGYNSNEPIWFGCVFTMIVPTGYMSGGGGYVLSREALKRFVTEVGGDWLWLSSILLGHTHERQECVSWWRVGPRRCTNGPMPAHAFVKLDW